jgi:hypothetical protein
MSGICRRDFEGRDGLFVIVNDTDASFAAHAIGRNLHVVAPPII